METEDPRAALDDPKVPVRAAAARDLARHGTWDDMERLVAKAWNDRSMAVRLYAAAAAADIACRGKGAFGQERLTPSQRDQVVRWAFAGDPGTSPSMLMLLGAVESAEVLSRLARIVRDPRSDVRLGVVTALRRMVLSGASQHASIARSIAPWLEDDRIPDDTRADLVKIVGEAGLTGLRDGLLALRQRGGPPLEVLDQALDRLAGRCDPATWVGLWRSDGLDVFEVAPAPRDDRLAVVTPCGWFEGGVPGALDLADGGARLGDEPARLVWATPLGCHEPALALQRGGRTWWQVVPGEVADVVEERPDALAALGPLALLGLRDVLAPLEGAGAQRAAVVLGVLGGDARDALARLDDLLARSKPRPDLRWWRARALADLGRAEEALSDVAAFLARAKKGQPFVDEAQALRKRLGG